MNGWMQGIIIGIVSTTLFEFGKYIKQVISNKMYIQSLPFSIKGYWCAYHEYTDKEKKTYQTYELIKIKVNKGNLVFRLYQYNEDGRFYQYDGCGYCRNDKVSLAYEEINNLHSNHTGTFNLLTTDKFNHKVVLMGVYSEFVKDSQECDPHDYCSIEYTMYRKDKFLKFWLRDKYVKKLMMKEDFKNECKKVLSILSSMR